MKNESALNCPREDEDRFMTARQVADRLGVSVSWLYDRARRGLIPSYKMGQFRRFRWEEIVQWMEEHRYGRSPLGECPPNRTQVSIGRENTIAL